MKSLNEKQIKILETLDALESVNTLISTANSGSEPDAFLAKNYERFKKELTEKLYVLLAEYDIPKPLLAALFSCKMEEFDEKIHEITQTLIQIKRVRSMISVLEQDADEAEKSVAQSYKQLETKLIDELYHLLAEYDIPTPLLAA
jgi:hypothetical protein